MLAIFSDIHSNLEALNAVLADMESLGIENRICLGDIVGYGPSPAACLRRVRRLNCPILLGNHDQAAATDMPLDYMRDVAVAGIKFSREKLSAKAKAFLNSLPMMVEQNSAQFVHSSLIDPEDWIYITEELEAYIHFSYQDRAICFNGHTHVPMVWSRSGDEFASGIPGIGTIELKPRIKYLVNVGSVGQPRDGDPKACYVIYRPKEKSVEFRRVEYDIAKTRRKIRHANLPKFLGQRLALGQ